MFGMFILAFAGGHFNIDEFRSAIEEMKPAEYLESGYYEHWLHALETLCIRNGSLTRQEIDERTRELARGGGELILTMFLADKLSYQDRGIMPGRCGREAWLRTG